MKNKEPFQLTNLLVLYNAAMTLLNLYIFVEVSEKKFLTLKGSLSHKSVLFLVYWFHCLHINSMAFWFWSFCSNNGYIHPAYPLAWENSQLFATLPQISPWIYNFHTDDVSLNPFWEVLLSGWSKSLVTWPIKSISQIWVVTRHQYGISAIIPQTPFRAGGKPVVALQNVSCFLTRPLRSSYLIFALSPYTVWKLLNFAFSLWILPTESSNVLNFERTYLSL